MKKQTEQVNWFSREDWTHLKRAMIVFLCINFCLGIAGIISMYYAQQQQRQELQELKEEFKEVKKYIYEKSAIK